MTQREERFEAFADERKLEEERHESQCCFQAQSSGFRDELDA